MNTSSSCSVFDFCVIGLVLVLVASFSGQVEAAAERKECKFCAVYNFGDSNSDTGLVPGVPGREATNILTPPGSSDGRLIIDFISENLMLPLLRPYTNETQNRSYEGGANFAKGGASILQGRGYSNSYLDDQISEFIRFKNENHLSPDGLSQSLFTVDIGQNDISKAFENGLDGPVLALFPDMLSNVTQGLRRLFDEGARTFFVHNTGPFGCLPNVVHHSFSKPDPIGCIESVNRVVTEFNKQLNATVCKLKDDLAGAAVTYVDVYAAKYQMISKATSFGFNDPVKLVCCVNGICCKDPGNYISWDATHYTEAANKFVAQMIVNGSVSSPQETIANACNANGRCSGSYDEL